MDPSQWTVRDETQDHPGRRKNSGFFQPIKHLSGQTETAAQKPLHYREKRGVWKRKSWNWFDRIPVQFTSTQTVRQIAASEFRGKKGRGREGKKSKVPPFQITCDGEEKGRRKEGRDATIEVHWLLLQGGRKGTVCVYRSFLVAAPWDRKRGFFLENEGGYLGR